MASDESALVSLEKYARIQTALRSAPRDQHARILEEHGFDQESWHTADEHWKAAIDRDAKQGEGELLLRWADAKEAATSIEPGMDATESSEQRPSIESPPVSSAPVVVQATPTFLRADAIKPVAPWPATVLRAAPAAPPPPLIRGSTREVDTTQLVGEALPFTPAKPGDAPLPIPIQVSSGPSALRGSGGGLGPPNGQATTLPIGYVLRPDAGHTETLDGYASVFAQVAVSPKEVLAICVKNGIPDDAAWKALQRRWTERLSADPELYRAWFKLYTQYRAAFERK